MKARHTPGPWKARGVFVGTDEPDPQTVAYADDHRNRKPRPLEQREADARFIAAAPALAEALAKLSAAVRLIRNGERNGAVFGMLSAADDIAREALALAGLTD